MATLTECLNNNIHVIRIIMAAHLTRNWIGLITDYLDDFTTELHSEKDQFL